MEGLRACKVNGNIPEPEFGPGGTRALRCRSAGKGNDLHQPVATEEGSPRLKTENAVIPPADEKMVILPPGTFNAPDIQIIGQIKKLNGIVAISVFDEGRNIILMGDIEVEPLLKLSRKMLETTRKIVPFLDWGPLVHMTLQVSGANVIIAPYRDYHLCLLTTRTINIGHIRDLRDFQQASEP